MARPAELLKPSRFTLLASICLVTAALYFAREVFIPLALAILISFLLSPLVTRLERFKIPRTVAVLSTVLLALCLVGFLGYQLVTQFKDLAEQLPKYRSEITSKIVRLRGADTLAKPLEDLREMVVAPTSAPSSHPSTGPTSNPVGQAAKNVNKMIPGAPPLQTKDAQPGAPALPKVNPDNPLPVRLYPQTTPVKLVLSYLGMAVHPIATAFLVIVFVIFMLLNREDLRDRMIRLVGAGRLNMTTTAVTDAATRISQYLLSLALVNLCYGLAVAGGLWLIGLTLGKGTPFPNPLLWGLMAGAARFIPYVGIWVASSAPMALAFGVYNGYGVFFAAGGMFLTYEAIVSQFVEPYLYGARTGMSTIAVLVAAVFWTWLWGPIGLLLSTPLTVVLVVVGKYVPQLEFLDILLGDEPVLPLPVRVYQRLIALDAEEAAELARNYLKEKPLESVYDDMLMPALAMAEHDRNRGKLPEERQTFIMQNMRDLVEELGDLNREKLEKKAAQASDATATAESAGAGAKTEIVAGGAETAVPKGCTVNVVCLPARDEADEIAALMLGQLLTLAGYCAFPVSRESLASEMIETVERVGAHLVVVSALPPAAVSHARYLCKRLHGRFPEINMLVGLWSAKGDLQSAKERITCDSSVQLSTTFADALLQVNQLAQPALLEARDGPSSTDKPGSAD